MPGTPGGAGGQSSGGAYISGGSYIGSQPATPSQTTPYPGGQQYPGMPVNSQTGGVSPTPYPQPYPGSPQPAAGGPGFGQPGGTTFPQPGMNMANNPAAGVIQQAIFGPRPGGAPQMGMSPIGGSGIAGFASTADADSIMIYNDRQNYGEWEFIYDPLKKPQVFNPLGGGIGTPAGNMPGAQQPGIGPMTGSPGVPNLPTTPRQ